MGWFLSKYLQNLRHPHQNQPTKGSNSTHWVTLQSVRFPIFQLNVLSIPDLCIGDLTILIIVAVPAGYGIIDPTCLRTGYVTRRCQASAAVHAGAVGALSPF